MTDGVAPCKIVRLRRSNGQCRTESSRRRGAGCSNILDSTVGTRDRTTRGLRENVDEPDGSHRGDRRVDRLYDLSPGAGLLGITVGRDGGRSGSPEGGDALKIGRRDAAGLSRQLEPVPALNRDARDPRRCAATAAGWYLLRT